VVFPKNASYRTDLLSQDSSGGLVLTHTAAGADSFRYSTNWGSSYSKWIPYTGKKTTVTLQPFSGTSRQKWSGEHVIVQYFSRLSGSSDYVQHGDVNHSPRRFPHLFLMGAFNEFGLDQGLPNDFSQESNGSWIFNFMTEWPARVQINQWGIDPSGQPDQSQVFGDIDGDNVLDRIPPQSLAPALINITTGPPSPFLAWKLSLDDATLKFAVVPVGNRWLQLIMFVIMAVIPTLTAAASIWVYTIG
jgi:alpha-1,3-glucan synthase